MATRPAKQTIIQYASKGASSRSDTYFSNIYIQYFRASALAKARSALPPAFELARIFSMEIFADSGDDKR